MCLKVENRHVGASVVPAGTCFSHFFQNKKKEAAKKAQRRLGRKRQVPAGTTDAPTCPFFDF